MSESPADQSAHATSQQAVAEMLAAFDNASMLESEKRILADLTARQIVVPELREKVLVRYLAANVVLLRFEDISWRIFASQIDLLRRVNENRETTRLHSLEVFRQRAIEGGPEAVTTWTMEQYVAYLVESGLLTAGLDGVTITQFGRDFLGYLVHRPHNGPRWL